MLAWTVPPPPRLQAASLFRCRLFDTASQSFQSAGPEHGTARMYVCGITPYDATHLGHANTYLGFDLLYRVWLDAGLDVHYVQNVTDIDDPLLERAEATGVDWVQLGDEQVQLFREDMAALNVLPPRDYVGAVESMPIITDLITRLDQRGALYAVEDGIYPDLYFSQACDQAFGSLGKLSEQAAVALFAERGGDPGRPGKKDPLDSLVWRLAREGEPSWDSPHGSGRPGWHIECTAIALHLLGDNFDVQAGGSDLIFPHHEMSASGGRVATDAPFARLFVHSGMVALDGEKMSKSRGNLVLVSTLRAAGVDPMAIRLSIIAHHYRRDWSWTDDALRVAERRLARWRQAVSLEATLDATEVIASMRRALADDLDAPAAIAAVDTWASASLSIDGDDAEGGALVAAACDALLGVRL